MAIDFPANPALQNPVNEFSPTSTPDATVNGVTYIWDGFKWTATAGGGGGGIPEAPVDGEQYGRQDADWTVIAGGGGGGIPEAPIDGLQYARQDADWTIIQGGGGDGDFYAGAAAWASVNSAGSTLAGMNIKETARTGVGQYTVEFINSMPSDNYAVTTGGGSNNISIENQTAAGFEVVILDNSFNFNDLSFTFACHATNALPPRGGTGADAWVNFDGTSAIGADCTIRSSFNVSRVNHISDGAYTVFLTNPMPSADFAVFSTANFALANNNITVSSPAGVATPNTVDSFTLVCTAAATNSVIDCEFVSAMVHATNAQLPDTVTQEEIDAALNNPGVSAWGRVDDTPTLLSALNVREISASGTNTTVYFNTPMPNANYSVSLGGGATEAMVTAQTAEAFTVATFASSGTPTRYGFDFSVFATNALPPRGGTGADCFGSVVSNALTASFNVNNLQNPEVGRYIIMFETPMPTADYSVTCTASITNFKASFFNKTVNGFDVYTVDLAQAGGIVQANVDFDFVVHATNAQLPSTITQEQLETLLELAENPPAPGPGAMNVIAWGRVNAADSRLTYGSGIEEVVERSNTSLFKCSFKPETQQVDNQYVVQVSLMGIDPPSGSTAYITVVNAFKNSFSVRTGKGNGYERYDFFFTVFRPA